MTQQTFTITAPAEGEPFFTGAGQITEEIDYTMPVSVAGRGFLIDRSPDLAGGLQHSRRSIDLVNTQNASDNEDATAITPEVWRRIADSWHMGAGQERFDRPNALPYRFSDSYNVDVWDEWTLKLLPATRQLRTLPAGKAHTTTVGPGRFVVVVGSQSWWWTDLNLAATSFSMGDNILDVTSDGANLLTVDDDGEVRRWASPSGTGTLLCTIPNFDPARAFISYVKGFIVAAGGENLYDITSGTPVLIYQHPLDGFTWRDAVDGMAAAYLLGGVGDKWGVYGMTITDDATTFDPPVAAAPIPEGEVGYALGTYLGYILIGCSTGWRFGVPSGDGTLTFGKLVETSAPVRCFEGQDRFVWYGLSGTNILERFSGLGRADLSVFTAPMTPAYASDLSTTVWGNVDGVITFGAGAQGAGKRVFTVEGVGVYCEDDQLATDGWVEQGGLSFNSADPKTALYLVVDHDPLRGGEVAVDVKYDAAGWVEVAVNDQTDSITIGNIPLQNNFHVVNIRYRLTRSSNGLEGPEVRRMEFRALNIPGSASQFVLPLMIRDDLYTDEARILRSAAEDYDFLINLWAGRRSFTYREAAQTFQVRVTDFVWLPEYKTANGSAYEGLMVLTAKEIR